MISPLHLRTVREVVRTGSFADAARTLGYTASAVSQQIAALERACGPALFERRARSVRPTSAAFPLVSKGNDVLSALDTLERELRTVASGERGAAARQLPDRRRPHPAAGAGGAVPGPARHRDHAVCQLPDRLGHQRISVSRGPDHAGVERRGTAVEAAEHAISCRDR